MLATISLVLLSSSELELDRCLVVVIETDCQLVLLEDISRA